MIQSLNNPYLNEALATADAIRKVRLLPANETGQVNSAIRHAITLRKIAAERDERGFRAMPLTDYLRWLARMADVQLPANPALAGNLPSPQATSVWIGLAESVGLERDWIRCMIRAWFASASQPTGTQRMAARTGLGGFLSKEPAIGKNSLKDAESALQNLESTYTEDQKDALLKALRLIS